MTTVLIIDDEPSVRFSLQRALSSGQLETVTANTGKAGVQHVRSNPPDLVLLDIRLPDMSGLDALQAIREIDQRLPVIIMTAHGTTETAIEATKRGAFDYLLKPFELSSLREAVQRGAEAGRLARRPTVLDPEAPGESPGDRIVGRSKAIQEVFKAIGRVADSDVNVLLLGESGVGKELVARAIYQHSRRAKKAFLAINCAAIPESLLESELFGHEKGAFTGADRQRIGKFEQATGGTIFLDEIGDMSPATQAKVLRLLQDQRFERVGGRETVQTDVRVIAATNQNLIDLVASGRFRQDLFYRLNTYTIAVPPLRARRDDIPLLASYFIARHAPEVGKQVHVAAPETLQELSAYPWPGNVRELQGVIKSALLNATSDVLTPESLPQTVRQGMADNFWPQLKQHSQFDLGALVDQLIATRSEHAYRKMQLAADRVILSKVMDAVQGNQVEASRLLGISRTTLRTKLQSLSAGGPDDASPLANKPSE